MWWTHPKFHNEIGEWWPNIQVSRWHGFQFMKKLQAIKGKLRIWTKEVFSNIEQAKSQIFSELEILDKVKESRNLDQLEWEERRILKLSD